MVLDRPYTGLVLQRGIVVSNFIRPIEFLSITFGTIFMVAVGMVF